MLILAIFGCLTCPIGLERDDQYRCVPVPFEGRSGPFASESFQAWFDDDLCDALQDCVCEELRVEDCGERGVSCEPVDWREVEGCAFDELAAEDCLTQGWTCEQEGDVVLAIPPPACERVYRCD